MRADLPGFGGGPPTPTLDGLAADGLVFDDCVASAAWTVPSLTSLVTGAFPHRVGLARWRHPFPRRRPTIMSAFAAAGFEVHSALHNPLFCLATTGHRGQVCDSEVPDQVVRALRAPAGSDRFVLVHHWWTHLPYEQERIPRKPWRARCNELIQAMADDPGEVERQKDRYADALAYLDQQLLPRYLEAAASSGQDVVFAFTADHGENWGEDLPEGHRLGHIYDLHGRWLTDGTTRVPLLIWGKGVPNLRIAGWTRGVDVAPTLCALAGVPFPGPLPDAEGPFLVDRDIAPDGLGLVIDGADRLNRVPKQALTVTTYNAIVPAKYPKAGRRLFCRYGLRTKERRYTWDRVHRLQEVEPPEPRSALTRLASRLDRTSVWSKLAATAATSVDPGPVLPRELFGVSRGKEKLSEQMAMLGYSDD